MLNGKITAPTKNVILESQKVIHLSNQGKIAMS